MVSSFFFDDGGSSVVLVVGVVFDEAPNVSELMAAVEETMLCLEGFGFTPGDFSERFGHFRGNFGGCLQFFGSISLDLSNR